MRNSSPSSEPPRQVRSLLPRRLGGVIIAAAIAAGSVVLGATAAQAAQAPGCSLVAGVPYKSGTQIKGSGSVDCNASAQRVYWYEIHRSEGWWHPTAVKGSWSGNRASYWLTISGCDAGSGTGTKQYFGQSFFAGYDAVLSGNTGELTICD